MLRSVLLALHLSLLLSACSSFPSPSERRNQAVALASPKGWHLEEMHAGEFRLAVFVPSNLNPSTDLAIYIEGDGFAWVSASQPSLDPTPRDPIALRLALAQPEGNAVYLARPCQYVGAESTHCNHRYWTQARFSPEVIQATNQVIDLLKARFKAKRLNLVGYSGGAAVAALVAARRKDVDRLMTVAGNLDPESWTTYHRIQPLTGSLNPADAVNALALIRQTHFVGGKDRVIPPELVQAYVDRFPHAKKPEVQVEDEFDHHCCWAQKWPELWEAAMGR